MSEILKSFLTNQIIVDWVAPIITGLILLIIPTAAIKFFQIRKDEKKILSANTRFVNSIRPYIIQKIDIEKNLITDIRSVIIKESCIKEKFIYTEIELRNKLIMDITEENYINEKNKKELVDFTYKVFSGFNIETIKNNDCNEYKPNKLMLIDRYIIIFIISITICTIIQIINKDKTNLEDNMVFSLSYVSTFFSLIVVLLYYFKNMFKSNISVEKKSYDIAISTNLKEVKNNKKENKME